MFKKSPTEQAMSDINAIIKLSQNIEAKAKEACSQTVSLISSLGKAKNKLVETIPQNYQIILDIFLGELEGREFEDNIVETAKTLATRLNNQEKITCWRYHLNRVNLENRQRCSFFGDDLPNNIEQSSLPEGFSYNQYKLISELYQTILCEFLINHPRSVHVDYRYYPATRSYRPHINDYDRDYDLDAINKALNNWNKKGFQVVFEGASEEEKEKAHDILQLGHFYYRKNKNTQDQQNTQDRQTKRIQVFVEFLKSKMDLLQEANTSGSIILAQSKIEEIENTVAQLWEQHEKLKQQKEEAIKYIKILECKIDLLQKFDEASNTMALIKRGHDHIDSTNTLLEENTQALDEVRLYCEVVSGELNSRMYEIEDTLAAQQEIRVLLNSR
jgi:hypothetical protein